MAIAITASLVSVTYFFYTFVYKHVLEGGTELDLHKTLRVKLEVLERDLRNAKEIVSIGPSRAEFKVFRDPTYEEEHVNLSGDDRTYRVVYELRKGAASGRDVIVKTVDGRESPLTAHDEIAPDIFQAWTWNLAGEFIPFDPVVNDSWQRERISLVRIRLKLRERSTTLELSGEVVPRFLHGKRLEPDWKFNADAQK